MMNGFFKRRMLFGLASLALVFSLFGAISAPATLAQAQLDDLSGAPVDIHEGTCDDFLAEPAYDGGDLETAVLDNLVDDDEWLDFGLFEDDELGTYGVDLDEDDALADNEIIGGVDEGDLPVAIAETDFGEDIDETQQYIVALHAGADQYGTILACGSITDADIDDDGNIVVDLQPMNDSGIFGFSVLQDDGGEIHTYLFQQGTAPASTPAPVVEGPEGFPVAIHQGDCMEWTTEPAFDVGVMEQTNVGAPGEQVAGVSDDGIIDDNDEGFLREDINEDGVFEVGIDENDDGILDDAEVLGLDEDDSGVLEEAEILKADTAFPTELGTVYTVDTDTQFDGQELIDEGPYIVGVHQDAAEGYDTLVACGPVVPVIEDDKVLVLMRPVSGADTMYAGAFLISEGEGELSGYIWPCEPIQADTDPTPTPAPTQTPTPEPTQTPTPVPSVVVVETEVVKESEVVGAPTATALAAQEGEPPAAIIDLGEEPAGPLTSAAGGTLTFSNPTDVERVFRVADLGIEETIPAGGELEVALPDDAEAGEYTYEVLEGDEVVYEDVLTVE